MPCLRWSTGRGPALWGDLVRLSLVASLAASLMALPGCGGTDYLLNIADSAPAPSASGSPTGDAGGGADGPSPGPNPSPTDSSVVDVTVGGEAGRSDSSAPASPPDAMTDAFPHVAPDAARPPLDGAADGPGDAATDASARDVGAPGDAEPADAPPEAACVPDTKPAACANVECGTVSNGCAGTHACGSCAPPKVCSANVCRCPVQTDAAYCENHGYSCGTATDECSGALRDCGGCTGSSTCGGGGNPHHCGCTPVDACAAQDSCGMAPDGCGAVVDCGACQPGTVCGPVAGQSSCGPNLCCSPCQNILDFRCLGGALSCDSSIVLPGCSILPGRGGMPPGSGSAVVWCCP
jgi:hypothetical protein